MTPAGAKVSVLVPVDDRRDTPEQAHAIASWRSILPGCEIVRGVNTDVPYNRSKALNDAASRATGDIFVVTDRDLIYPAARTAVDRVRKANRWVMSDVTIRLGRIPTRAVLRGRLFDRTMERAPGNDRYKAKGGVIVLSRKLWDQVSGMDHRFQGWGNEDIAFMCALRTFRGQPERRGIQWHMYHPAIYRPGTRSKLWAGQTEEHIDIRTRLTAEYRAAEGSRDAMQTVIDGRHSPDISPADEPGPIESGESESVSDGGSPPPVPHAGPTEA